MTMADAKNPKKGQSGEQNVFFFLIFNEIFSRQNQFFLIFNEI